MDVGKLIQLFIGRGTALTEFGKSCEYESRLAAWYSIAGATRALGKAGNGVSGISGDVRTAASAIALPGNRRAVLEVDWDTSVHVPTEGEVLQA
jgi:hypothetical protein